MIRRLIIISLFLFSLSYDNRTSADSGTSPENAAPARKPVANPNQWALLIGVGDYPGNTVDLKYPGADARSIKELLTSSAGFPEDHVRLLTDNGVGGMMATKENIFSTIDQYLAPRVQPGHEIIVFLAGHGIVDGVGTEAKSYFLPVDTDIQSKETVARTAVDMEELTRKLSTLKASQFTIFYDACREDPSPGRGFKGNPLTDVTARILTLGPAGPQQQQRTNAPTSVVFYACQIGERAFESQQLEHGVFTYYILRGLRELADRPDGRVEAGRLAGYLNENVRKWSQEARNPFGQNQNPTMVAADVHGPIMVARVLPLSGNVPETATVSGIRLDTYPEGATISINGQQAGRGPIQKDLAPKQYTVRAEMPGFQPSETKIDVIAGYRQEVTISLQAATGNSSYEKGIQFERRQLLPQAIASYQQALAEDPNSESSYESLAQAYVKIGRYREAVNLLLVAEQKFPNSALILARRSRAQSAMKLGEEVLVASAGPQSNTESGKEPDEGSGKKSKKGKGAKKNKNNDEEVLTASATQSDEGVEEESGKKSKKSKGAKKNKNKEALAPPAGSQSFAPQTGASQPDEGAKEGTEVESGQESGQESGKKSKKSKGGKGGKKSDKESSEVTQNVESQSSDIQHRGRLAGPMVAEVQDNGPVKSCDAIRDAELAIQKDGNLADSHLALGFALLADGKDYDRALASLTLASTIAPEDAETYYGVGYAYRLKQQFNLAVPQLKKAIELRPNYYEAYRELAYCYHATGATDLAIRQYVIAISYRAATKETSEYAANNVALGSLYRKRGLVIGGSQGELWNLTGKACEDDARKEEPDLSRAINKLASAGILKYVAENAPPEIRKLIPESFTNGASPLNAKPAAGAGAPCNCNQPAAPVEPKPVKEPKSKKDKGKKIKPEKYDGGQQVFFPPTVITVPVPVGPRRPPRYPPYPGYDPKNPGRPKDPGKDKDPGRPKGDRDPERPKGDRDPGRPGGGRYPGRPGGGRYPGRPGGNSGPSAEKPPSPSKPSGGIILRRPNMGGMRPSSPILKTLPPRGPVVR